MNMSWVSKTNFKGVALKDVALKNVAKVVLGVSLLQSLTCSAEIACGGLFLLNDYSVSVGEHRFFARAEYDRFGFKYGSRDESHGGSDSGESRDGWSLDAGSRGFPTRNAEGNFAWTLGFESSYKYLTLGASAGSSLNSGEALPWVSASMVLHSPDSMFYAGAGMARGSRNLATVKWQYLGENDLVPDISATWETHILKKDFAAGFKARDRKGREHRLDVSASLISSTPHNLDDEYFIRDSLNILTLGADYRWNGLHVGYDYANAEGRLYGIRKQDNSLKRFIYAPFSGSLHLAELGYETPLPNLDINAIAAYGQAQLHKDNSRFHETLAPNRALRNSVMQALSFSFLQQSYRVEANADGGLGLVGVSYHQTFGVSGNLYYAKFTADADLTSERKQFISTVTKTESHLWDVESFGAIAGISFKFNFWRMKVDANAYQLLPIYTDTSSSGSEPTTPESSKPNKFHYTFGNGMICTLNVGFDF